MRFVCIASVLAIVLSSPAISQVVTTTAGQTYLAVVGDASGGGICNGPAGPAGPCVNAGRGILLGTFATSADVSSQFATVNGQLGAFNTQLNTFSGQLTGFNTQLTGFSTQLTGFNTQLAGVSAQLTTFNGQLTGFNTQLSSFTSQLTGVTSQVATINNEIAAINSQIRDSISFTAAVGAMHDAIPLPGDRFAVRLNTAAVDGVVAGGFSASANVTDHFRASFNYGGTRGQNVVSGGLNFSFN